MSGRRLLHGLVGLVAAGAMAAGLLYLSRFWVWTGNGDLLRGWLGKAASGVGLWEINAFDILVWGLAIFGALSLLQWLWNRAAPHDE